MHLPSPAVLFPAMWVAWAITWIAAARWSSPAVARPATGPVIVYRALITLGVLLMAARAHSPMLWHFSYPALQAMAFLTIPGFLFAWWARLHLGRLWSGSVTRKEVHRIIDTGPYALVRHPIYTGLLWAGLVSGVAGGSVLSLVGFALFAWGIWRKARLEEGFLSAELGPDAYAQYAARVPMLLPFGGLR